MMSDDVAATIASLYASALREADSDTLQELDSEIYAASALHIESLKLTRHDGAGAEIKDALVGMMVELVRILLNSRIKKAQEITDHINLLDEERYILDFGSRMQERQEAILSIIQEGRVRQLEDMMMRHKTRLLSVRFLQDMDQFVGSDMDGYGPFSVEDVASIPYENAQALISQGVVVKV